MKTKKRNKGLLALDARNQAIKDMKQEYGKNYIPCSSRKSFNMLMISFAMLAKDFI